MTEQKEVFVLSVVGSVAFDFNVDKSDAISLGSTDLAWHSERLLL